jgi:hypothetical protein
MNKIRLLCTATVLFVCMGMGQTVLYHSPRYTIYGDRVTQGTAVAKAVSDSELTSTYKSPYRVRTPRHLDMKFCLNGADDENVAGLNHVLLLPSGGGVVEAPLYRFGEVDSGATATSGGASGFISHECVAHVRVDMRKVLRNFGAHGFHETATGHRVRAEEFKGVFLAGSIRPLTWDFSSLASRSDLQCRDDDRDSIFEVTVHIPAYQVGDPAASGVMHWKQSANLSAFPSLHSRFPIVNALYNNALEEMLQNVRPDGAFMAGAMWPGVWTRDISYSIILSLAIVAPDASQASLMAKVHDGCIIQDTGTGGSWPVSSDRLVWALAAWEIYKTTGDRSWLQNSYAIIRKSLAQDRHAVLDAETGLCKGESSFLDWREQTYPRWMDPKDIYASKCLSTNVVHFEALRICAAMANILGDSTADFSNIADGIRENINKQLWIERKGYYGQYLYGRTFPSVSERSDALGEALAVLYGVADDARAARILRSTPVEWSGIPCVYPQSEDISPYHNKAVWPFVEAFWGWASARNRNGASVEHALGSISRAAALFGTNKENLIAANGDYMGTEINSSRQLWSVAGNIASTLRVLYGINLTADSLVFSPFVPKAYAGEMTLHGFRYRGAILDVVLQGWGCNVSSATLDGSPMKRAVIGDGLKGRHTLVLVLNNEIPSSRIKIVGESFAPLTPVPSLKNRTISWSAVPHAVEYVVRKNGKPARHVTSCSYTFDAPEAFAEYQVEAVDRAGHASFLSEPIAVSPEGNALTVKAAPGGDPAGQGDGVLISVAVTTPGLYIIEFRYANGSGPINTDNKCAIRTLTIDGGAKSVVVFPQRGTEAWDNWGYSSPVRVRLTKGEHTIRLSLTAMDANMNGAVNTALVDSVRLTLMRE